MIARAAAAICLVVLLCGATCQRREVAPVADADPSCYRASIPSTTDTGVRWEGNADDPATWDDLGGRAWPELVRRTLATERSRQSCAGFIEDLKRRGVIRAPVAP